MMRDDVTSLNNQEFDELLRSACKEIQVPDTLCEETLNSIQNGSAQSFMYEQPASGFTLVQPKRPRSYKVIWSSLAAAVLLLGLCMFGVGSWNHVVTVVSLDVNPSIEISLNPYQRVIDSHAYNEDGEEIIERINVHGLACEEAVTKLLSDSAIVNSVAKGTHEGYTKDESAVEITVVSFDGHKNHAAQSTKEVAHAVHDSHCPSHMNHMAQHEYQDAQDLGMSPGKYRMYQELREGNPDLSTDDVNHLPMRELKHMAKHGCHSDAYIEGNEEDAHESCLDRNHERQEGQRYNGHHCD